MGARPTLQERPATFLQNDDLLAQRVQQFRQLLHVVVLEEHFGLSEHHTSPPYVNIKRHHHTSPPHVTTTHHHHTSPPHVTTTRHHHTSPPHVTTTCQHTSPPHVTTTRQHTSPPHVNTTRQHHMSSHVNTICQHTSPTHVNTIIWAVGEDVCECVRVGGCGEWVWDLLVCV